MTNILTDNFASTPSLRVRVSARALCQSSKIHRHSNSGLLGRAEVWRILVTLLAAVEGVGHRDSAKALSHDVQTDVSISRMGLISIRVITDIRRLDGDSFFLLSHVFPNFPEGWRGNKSQMAGCRKNGLRGPDHRMRGDGGLVCRLRFLAPPPDLFRRAALCSLEVSVFYSSRFCIYVCICASMIRDENL